MATDYRSTERSGRLTFRFSDEEVEELHRQAVEEGYSSMQQLAEARFFGEARPRRRPGPRGPRRKSGSTQSEQLGLSA